MTVTATLHHSLSTLSTEDIEHYRQNGFVRVQNIITPQEAAHFHEAALRFLQEKKGTSSSPMFDQLVNVWRQDEAMKSLTLHRNVAAAAETLAGVPQRLWHDQLLIKQPQRSTPTEFHQDQPYWPHGNSTQSISCWIALCDVPVERGCMTFLPGSHRRTDLEAQNLSDAHSLFSLAPDLQWSERVTVPLRKGDCTFHHGRCAHMATPNDTDDPRVAHVIIYLNEGTRYTRRRHVVTDPLGLEERQLLEGELFPRAADFAVDSAR